MNFELGHPGRIEDDVHRAAAGVGHTIRADLAPVDVGAADVREPRGARAPGVDDVHPDHLGPVQAEGDGGQQADRPQPRHQAPAAMEPVRRGERVWQACRLHAHGLVDRLHGHRQRLREHADAFQLGRHRHQILLRVDGELRLEPIEPPDAALAEVPGVAHVGTVHVAGLAPAAAAPVGEDGIVAGFGARDARADLDNLPEHLVADDEIAQALGGARAPAGRLLPVRATNPHAHDA